MPGAAPKIEDQSSARRKAWAIAAYCFMLLCGPGGSVQIGHQKLRVRSDIDVGEAGHATPPSGSGAQAVDPVSSSPVVLHPGAASRSPDQSVTRPPTMAGPIRHWPPRPAYSGALIWSDGAGTELGQVDGPQGPDWDRGTIPPRDPSGRVRPGRRGLRRGVRGRPRTASVDRAVLEAGIERLTGRGPVLDVGVDRRRSAPTSPSEESRLSARTSLL